MKVVRIIFFLLILFLALPEFMLGGPALMNGIRAHGDVWSVRHDYFTDAAITLIAGLVAVGFAAWGAFWPGRTNWLRFLVATSIVFLMAVSIPGWYSPPAIRSRNAMTGKMRALGTAAEAWADARGRFPLTNAELAEAANAGEVRLGDSPFQRGGKPVQFELVVTSAATGPVLRADRPGIICYAVYADGRRDWITATGLPAAVSEAAVIITESSNGGPPLVITGILGPAAPPTAASKPALKNETKKK